MALQYDTTLRNNQLDQIEVTIGTAPLLHIRVGAPPANCAAADSGTLLASITLPSDWMTAAAGGSKGMSGGPWTDSSADATGTAGHFRIKNSGNTTCFIQGTVGTSNSEMIVDSVSFTAGQSFSVNSFSITAGNA